MCGSKCCSHENISLKHEEPDKFDRSQVFLNIFFYSFIDMSKIKALKTPRSALSGGFQCLAIFFFLPEIKIIINYSGVLMEKLVLGI